MEDVKKKIYDWGTQKVLDAMSAGVKEGAESKSKAETITQGIWLDTLTQCSKPLNYLELEGLFRRKVQDWCDKQNQ